MSEPNEEAAHWELQEEHEEWLDSLERENMISYRKQEGDTSGGGDMARDDPLSLEFRPDSKMSEVDHEDQLSLDGPSDCGTKGVFFQLLPAVHGYSGRYDNPGIE